MKVVAKTRTVHGSGASRRLRLSGKVPGIIYGGNGNDCLIGGAGNE
jgi:large subunit ribosomal protein L25